MNPNEPTLESWKEISAYLQRDAKTARKWEKEEGLPIHRHTHSSRSSVYAYPSEIDAWRASRKAVPEPRPLWKTLLIPPRPLAFGATLALCLVMVGNGVRPQTASAQAAAPVTRQVWTGPNVNLDGSGLVSPDGRYLFFVDGRDVALRDLANGAVRRLTNHVPGETAWEPVISPDGKQMAYRRRKDNHSQLRLIGLNGSDPATAQVLYDKVLYDNEDVNGIAFKDWSPDGKRIAVQIVHQDRNTQIGLISATDGSLRVLKSIDWRYASKVFFSPDGRYLAFDLQSSEKQLDQRDVFVLATDGTREIPAVAHQANDVVMGWTPDGTYLLFASDRTGAMGLWALPFRDGKPQGAARLVKADIGTPRPLGITRSGALYFGVRTEGSALYTASLDFTSGKVLTPPRQELAGFDPNEADWSPDGKYLTYRTSHYPLRFQDALTVRSVETGQTRELRPNLYTFSWPRWAPDGRSFAVQGQDRNGRPGIYRVDAQTAAVSPLVQDLPGVVSYFPQWAPDGKRIFYRLEHSATKSVIIIERDLASGKEREVWRGNPPALGLSVAPDGRYVAFYTSDPVTQESMLLAVPVAAGEPRELIRVQALQSVRNWTEWTRDSRSIIFQKELDTAAGWVREYWLVPLAGGQPRKLDLGSVIRGPFRVHPDGSQVVFISGVDKLEVWVLESFLPMLNASK